MSFLKALKPNKKASEFLKTTFLLFFTLGIVFIPFSFLFSSIQLWLTSLLFTPLTRFIQHQYHLKGILNDYSSDSLSLCILLVILFIISMLISLFTSRIKSSFAYSKLNFDLSIILRLFIGLVLLKYGIDKILMLQFPIPAENLLFTDLGKLEKDILFWSSMGSSASYNYFTGSLELIAGISMLFDRTYLLGLVVSSGIFLNVLAINIGFDISVKLFAGFLFAMTIFLLSNYFIYLKHVLIPNNTEIKYLDVPIPPLYPKKRILKYGLYFLILLELGWPHFTNQLYSSDDFPRPELIGAYAIETSDQYSFPYQRIFIHKDGYFIGQDADGEMEDYQFHLSEKSPTLRDYEGHEKILSYKYNRPKSALILTDAQITFNKLNIEELPLMKSQNHFLIDLD